MNVRAVIFIVCIVLGAYSPDSKSSELLTLEAALKAAGEQNSELSAFRSRSKAEASSIKSEYWLDNPKIGLMREEQMTRMQQEMGPMNSWTVSQEIKFPTKYFLLGDAQTARARASNEELSDKALEIRQRVISSYFALYSVQRELALLDAQKETLREIARVAEARRATGAVPQQDEMKAHVEQTKLENEIILRRQEREEKLASFNSLLGREVTKDVVFAKDELRTPKLNVQPSEISKLALNRSKALGASQFMVEEANKRKKLAYQSYLPDFMISYRKPYGNAPPDAYALGVEMTIPLWFFAKQTSEVQVASARFAEAEANLETLKRSTQAEVHAQTSKVEAFEKLLRIYETALIPQATSTLNSSRSSYRAGRSQFLDLLDSERSLYEVRINYYETLAKFVDALTQLERVVGTSLSTLPFEEAL